MSAPAEPAGVAGETAVIGLGKSGVAAAELLARDGSRVYVSDVGSPLSAKEADRLRELGVAIGVGGHDLDRIARAALVVASPGVPPEAAPLAAARRAGVPIVSEIEVGLRYLGHTRCIAVTGTNGKTTTTALIAHLLAALGRRVEEGGNIGTPLTRLALSASPPEWIALEISSFQLHDTPGITPAVGVLTNLSPDHLDRYPSVAAYYADKRLLFRNAHASSVWVTNADQSGTMEMVRGVRGAVHLFSLRTPQPHGAWYDRDHGTLMLLGAPLMRREELSLLGDHNIANALAAALSVMVADEEHRTADGRARVAAALRSFRALAHRLEVVGEFGGVLWINDSKATNVSSTLVAIEGMTRPSVVLLGGRHKGEPYSALIEPLRRNARAVIAYGEAASAVARDLAGSIPVEVVEGDFDRVLARARALARPGDAVLLSPACSSFDMFTNYEERGVRFRQLAAEPGKK